MKFRLFFIFLLFWGKPIFANNHKDSLLVELKKAHKDSIRAIILNELCATYRNSNPDSAGFYGTKGLAIANKINSVDLIAKIENNLGVIFLNQGKLDTAEILFNRCLEKRRLINDSLGLANTYTNLGIIKNYRGKYNDALPYYFKAETIYEKLNRVSSIIASNTNLGSCYNNLKQPKKALEYHKKAMNYSFRKGFEQYLPYCYINIGFSFEIMKELDSAGGYYKRGYEIARGAGNPVMESTLLCNLGVIEAHKNNHEESVKYYLKSLEIDTRIHNKEGIIRNSQNIGEYYIKIKNYSRAMEYLTRGLELAYEMDNKDLLLKLLITNSGLFKAMGDYKKAYDFFSRYSELKESIYNKENSEQIAEMATKYETEKKQNEIKLLNKDKSIREKEISKQLVIRNYLIGIVLLIMILGFSLFRAYKNKQKANFQLQAQKQEIVKKNEILEIQKDEILLQKNEINQQKHILEEKNKEVLDSIFYARRIQRALLTSDQYLSRVLPGHFLLYQPKDIVSGDFYWVLELEDKRVLTAIADCTGHGVPGAFMSMIGISFLNEIVIEKKITRPDLILNQLRFEVIRALNPEGSEESKDGMDIALCLFDIPGMKLQYSGANNSLYHINAAGNINEIKANKFPVGKYIDESKDYTLHEINLSPGDCVYTFSDGYADQFGGPKGKKFKYKQLEDLLVNLRSIAADQRMNLLKEAFNNWKGELEQVDDICLLGVQV